MESLTFGLVDYIIFGALLIVSVGCGLYFGFVSKSKNTTEEYLMGGRKMKVFPVAMSMVASVVSSLSVLAFPAEIYAFGINFYFVNLAMVVSGFFVWWCVLPIYYNNKISTCYEYLELRFDRATRKLATIAFIGSYILFLPMFLYLPSAALSQVTNVNMHVINAVINGVCVFYTMFGGIKAVVWTDVVQGVVMMGAVLFVCIMGIAKVGGLRETWRIASEARRLDVDFTFDLETRITFWNCMLNYIIFLTTYVGFNQSSVQRMISLPTLQQSKQSVLIFVVLYIFVVSVCCFNGVVMFAYFRDCDPILTGQVQKSDKLMPHFVQQVAGHLWGVPGVFMSGLFSAALSTASAAMNSLAAVVYFDYVRPFVRHRDGAANLVIKLLTLGLGIYNLLGCFVYEQFLSFVQLFFTFSGVFYGALFSCFTLGFFVPRIHGKCIFWGMIISIAAVLAFMICAVGKAHYQSLGHTTVEACESNFSSAAVSKSLSNGDADDVDGSFDILKMSFNWFIVMGALIVLIVSLPLSYILTDTKKAGYNRKLLAPIALRLVEYQLTKQAETEQL